MNHYTYRAEWSSEFREYVGRCLELPWLTQSARSLQQAIAAVEQNVSMNQWVVQKLADRPPIGLFDL